MSAKEKKEQFSDIAGKYLVSGYLLLMWGIFPAFYTDGLFQITQDKKSFFVWVTAILCIFLCLLEIRNKFNLIKENNKKRKENTQEKRKPQIDSIFLFVLFCATWLSLYAAINREEAFYGLISRKIGVTVMLCCIAAFLAVRKYGSVDTITVWGMLLGSGFIYVCGILCSCKINFLHIQDQVATPEIFPTPIGNINFNACYLSLVLPFVMVLFLLCKERFSEIIYAVSIYMGFVFHFFLRTDSAVLMMIASFIVLLYFAVEKKSWREHYMQMTVLYLAAGLTVTFARILIPKHIYSFDGIGEKMLRLPVMLPLVIIAVGIWFLQKKTGERFWEKLRAIRNIVLCAGIIVIILTIVCFILVNTVFAEQAKKTAWEALLLKDRWFSARGYIWTRTVHEFGKLPLKNKLFGTGLNCFYHLMTPIYREDMMNRFGAVYYDPHNEFLQVLTAMGIVGVIGYFGLILYTLYRSLRTWKKNENQLITAVTLPVYLLQGLVNSYTIFQLPLLFIFLGLANGCLKEEK